MDEMPEMAAYSALEAQPNCTGHIVGPCTAPSATNVGAFQNAVVVTWSLARA